MFGGDLKRQKQGRQQHDKGYRLTMTKETLKCTATAGWDIYDWRKTKHMTGGDVGLGSGLRVSIGGLRVRVKVRVDSAV